MCWEGVLDSFSLVSPEATLVATWQARLHFTSEGTSRWWGKAHLSMRFRWYMYIWSLWTHFGFPNTLLLPVRSTFQCIIVLHLDSGETFCVWNPEDAPRILSNNCHFELDRIYLFDRSHHIAWNGIPNNPWCLCNYFRLYQLVANKFANLSQKDAPSIVWRDLSAFASGSKTKKSNSAGLAAKGDRVPDDRRALALVDWLKRNKDSSIFRKAMTW